MSLIRQTALLLVASLLLALLGGVLATGSSLRALLTQQASIKNADNAQALALAASQQGGDPALIQLLMNAQFDQGHYRLLRWRGADGRVVFERSAAEAPGEAPAWLRELAPLEAQAGLAQLSSGWQALGQIELHSQLSYAYDALWHSLLRAAAWAALISLLALVLARWVLSRIRRPLDQLAAQAEALAEGRFLQVDASPVRELRPLTAALNEMVQRIQRMFEAQTEQLGLLRQQAHHDALTGLYLRQQFLAELASALARDDGPPRASLLLLRLQDLAEVNRQLGRDATDQVLQLMAEALQHYTDRVQGSMAGRLNGADFALWLPAAGVLDDSGEALAEALQQVLLRAGAQGGGGLLRIAVGGAELARSRPLSQWFARADQALAEAEQRGGSSAVPRCLRQDDDADQPGLPEGEGAWRAQIEAALAQQRTRLLQFPVLDRAGRLLHWECPLQLGLAAQPEGSAEFVSAKVWLPMAQRTGLGAEVDLAAVAQALALIAHDGQLRAVNLAPASLLAPDFLQRLRALLKQSPAAARQLALEFDISAALRQFELLQELGCAVRPLGVRLGLEHAGAQLERIERLYQLGLDYVKLDVAVLSGVADDAGRAGFLRSLVLLLQGLSLQVIAEGVEDEAQASALWDCGLSGLTGPWATAHQVR